MSLSCSCGYDDYDADWYFSLVDDFSILKSRRSKRCCSCKELIKPGAVVVEFWRYRYPRTEVEVKILGEDAEIPLASWFMCEACGEIFLNINALGYCVDIGEDNMHNILEEYKHESGFDHNRWRNFGVINVEGVA